MIVVIRGAGDLATGIALRLYRSGYQLVMTDLPEPTAIRRTVCFSEAIRQGEMEVEGVQAVCCTDAQNARNRVEQGLVAVLGDSAGACIPALKPGAVVDAIFAKKNLGTAITDAPVVIGVGPGVHRRRGLPRRSGDQAGPHAGPGVVYRFPADQYGRAGHHRRLWRRTGAARTGGWDVCPLHGDRPVGQSRRSGGQRGGCADAGRPLTAACGESYRRGCGHLPGGHRRGRGGLPLRRGPCGPGIGAGADGSGVPGCSV